MDIKTKARRSFFSNKLSIAIFLIIWFLISIFLCLFNKVTFESGTKYIDRTEWNFSNVLKNKDDYIEQTFYPQYSYLSSIDIRLALNHKDLVGDFILGITLYNNKNEILIYEEVKQEQIENWTYYNFKVEKALEVNEKYKIRIQQILGEESTSTEYWISYVIFESVEHIPEHLENYYYNNALQEGEFEVTYNYEYISIPLFIFFLIINLAVCLIVFCFLTKGAVFFEVIRIIIFLIHMISNLQIYPYDSGLYWNLGYTFGLENFNITNYSNELRGYLYPLLNFILIKWSSIGIGTEEINLWIFHSIFYSFAFLIFIPKFVERIFSIKISYYIRCLFTLICIYIFKGLIVYPLSDLPAFIFLLMALNLLFSILEEKMSLIKRGVYSILIGVFLGAAYYIRPVYLIVIIGFGIIAIYYIVFKKKYSLLCSLLGLLIVAIPQIMINSTHFNTYSPLVQTQEFYDGQSLYLRQLTSGLHTQKYETNMDLTTYENASMRFKDTIGMALLEKKGSFTGYFDYFHFVMTHIIDVGCIYLKHIFNGMDITYNNAYIYDLNSNRFIIQLLNYSLIFLGIQGIVWYWKNIKGKLSKILIGILYLLPICLVIPTAVETRFFIGLHVLFYILAFIILQDKRWREMLKEKKIEKIFYYCLFLLICFLLNAQTFNCYGIPLW